MSLYADLTTLLGDTAQGNFYLQALPQEYELPCVIFRVLHKQPITNLCGNTGEAIYEVVFECIGETFSDAELAEAEVSGILDSDSTLTKWVMDGAGEDFEPVTEDFMQPVFYGFHYKEG